MSRVIYKYPIRSDEFSISMPYDAVILSCAVQNGDPYLWALHSDPTDCEKGDITEFVFRLYATGASIEINPLDSSVRGNQFVGTLLLSGGMFVFHLFCLLKRRATNEL